MASFDDGGLGDAPLTTRLLVEVWWETRERRWRRATLRGRITELPDGAPRAFSRRRRLVALVLDAVCRSRRPRRRLRPR